MNRCPTIVESDSALADLRRAGIRLIHGLHVDSLAALSACAGQYNETKTARVILVLRAELLRTRHSYEALARVTETDISDDD